MIGWVAVILSISGAYLVAKKSLLGFVFWTISNSLWIIHNYMIEDYPQLVLFSIYLFISMFGWYKWRKDEDEKERN